MRYRDFSRAACELARGVEARDESTHSQARCLAKGIRGVTANADIKGNFPRTIREALWMLYRLGASCDSRRGL